MNQAWVTVAGLCLDFAGVALIAFAIALLMARKFHPWLVAPAVAANSSRLR